MSGELRNRRDAIARLQEEVDAEARKARAPRLAAVGEGRQQLLQRQMTGFHFFKKDLPREENAVRALDGRPY